LGVTYRKDDKFKYFLERVRVNKEEYNPKRGKASSLVEEKFESERLLANKYNR